MTTFRILVDNPALILVPSSCQLIYSKLPRVDPLVAALFIQRLVNCLELMGPQKRGHPPLNPGPAGIQIIGLEDALQGEIATYGVRGVKLLLRRSAPYLSIHLQIKGFGILHTLDGGPGFVAIMGLVHQIYFRVNLDYVQIT